MEARFEIGDEVDLVDDIPEGDEDNDFDFLLGQTVEIIDMSGGEYLIVDEDGDERWIYERWIATPKPTIIADDGQMNKILEALDGEELSVSPKKVGDIARAIFGEDRVDIKIRSGYRNPRYEIYIHFPELELLNSEKSRHTIYDLYVKFGVRVDVSAFEAINYKCNIDFTGRRNTCTIKEMLCGYQHSHMDGGVGKYNNFCLGSSAFREVLENLKMSMSPDDWELMFLSLENYLNWESLEGGPYYKIRDLSYGSSVTTSDVEGGLLSILAGMPTDIWDFSCDNLTLVDNTSFRGYMNKNMPIRDMREKISPEGYSYAIEMWEKPTAKLEWKGGEIPFKVKNEFEGVTNKADKVPTVDNTVVDICRIVLNEKAKNFIKKLDYDTRKNNHYEKTFRKVRAF